MSKPRKISRLGIVIGGIVALLVGAYFVTIYAINVPFHVRLTQPSVLDGSQKLYSRKASIAGVFVPANDSYVVGLYRLAPGKAKLAVAQKTILSACTQKVHYCSQDPTWRPRADFVQPSHEANIFFFDTVVSHAAKAHFDDLVKSKTTECTGYNLSGGSPTVNNLPNIQLLCVNSDLNLLTYEYISDHDSKQFQPNAQ